MSSDVVARRPAAWRRVSIAAVAPTGTGRGVLVPGAVSRTGRRTEEMWGMRYLNSNNDETKV